MRCRGCSNTPNAEKGIALHMIPFFGDIRSEPKARRKKWTDFVKLKRVKWTAPASSTICSCHFPPEDFAQRHSFGSLKQQRTLIKDDIGILPIMRFHKNTFKEEFTLQAHRQVSLHVCCLVFISLLRCEMPANWNFITCFAKGFPMYCDLYLRS